MRGICTEQPSRIAYKVTIQDVPRLPHQKEAQQNQASQSITNSWSLLKLMSIELVMPSNHLILCLLLLLPSIYPTCTDVRVGP